MDTVLLLRTVRLPGRRVFVNGKGTVCEAPLGDAGDGYPSFCCGHLSALGDNAARVERLNEKFVPSAGEESIYRSDIQAIGALICRFLLPVEDGLFLILRPDEVEKILQPRVERHLEIVAGHHEGTFDMDGVPGFLR